MFFRVVVSVTVVLALAAAGCATQPKLTPEQVAKLKGGRTTVIAYFECAPINYLTGGKMMTYTSAISVDGEVVGKIEYCGHTRFTVDSGQRELAIGNPNNIFAPNGISRPEIFQPGVTQYLAIYQEGYNVFHRWVSQSVSEAGIEAINKVKSVF